MTLRRQNMQAIYYTWHVMQYGRKQYKITMQS